MRTLTLHTADELAARWKRQAAELSERGALRALKGGHNNRLNRLMSDLDNQQAQTLRCCASELQALVAVSMEMEAAHAGDPEPEPECPACELPRNHDGPCALVPDPNALLEWSQGRRP